jgi:predicted nucleotidyltransferase
VSVERATGCPKRTALTVDEALSILREHRQEIVSFGVSKLAICGSVARGDADGNSDLDLVVEMDLSLETRPFRRYFGLLRLLEVLLQCPVDLLTYGEIKPHVRASIGRDLIPVFPADESGGSAATDKRQREATRQTAL